MRAARSWWHEAGELLRLHPTLGEATGVRGFAGGAEWMHRAMGVLGWRMPPFCDAGAHRLRGLVKYSLCASAAALLVLAAVAAGGAGFVPVLAILGFYSAEAPMVFLFPEALLGRRRPWGAAWRLTHSAGGIFPVMGGVIPIAARMVGEGCWRGRSAWLQGCLAVLLWHREVSMKQRLWTDDDTTLSRGEIGAVNPLFLRRESVGTCGRCLRVLWISDLHWRGESDARTLLAIRDLVALERPDVCLLGGDFIERWRALPLFRVLVGCLAKRSVCVALPGNHDRGSFLGEIRRAVISAGGRWLPDEPLIRGVTRDGREWEILANGESLADGGDVDSGRRTILAVHDPAELDRMHLSPGTVVMAGHLHGGQWVLSSSGGRLLPAAWVYPHAWLRRSIGGVEWLVGRGAGDTLPLRWRCPREVLLAEIYETF